MQFFHSVFIEQIKMNLLFFLHFFRILLSSGKKLYLFKKFQCGLGVCNEWFFVENWAESERNVKRIQET